jgi:membrane fusion protein (multidrug efflux system)
LRIFELRFVIRVRNGVTQWVDVRPGFNLGDRTEVFGDLAAGGTLVAKANEALNPG